MRLLSIQNPSLDKDLELGGDGAVNDEVGRGGDHDKEVADTLQAHDVGVRDPDAADGQALDSGFNPEDSLEAEVDAWNVTKDEDDANAD